MPGARARVLLVEDELLITLLLEDMLQSLDCEIAEAPADLEEALAAAQSGAFDLALVDLSLGGELTYPVADILKARRIPFAFMTGYASASLAPAYAETPVLEKPFHQQDLAATIDRILPSNEV